MSDVFVSYKAEDRRRVKPLVEALEREGLSVWWDAHLGGGEEWRETIVEHLDAARAVVVVWSKRSVGPEGDFVRDEASRAKRRGIYIPVRIDKVDPPLGFGETQAIDVRGWGGDRANASFQALLAAVRDPPGARARSSFGIIGGRTGHRPTHGGGRGGDCCRAVPRWRRGMASQRLGERPR